MVMPPVDHECSLQAFVTELADRLAKLERENAQLKKTLYERRSERSKLPRVKTDEPATPGAEGGHASSARRGQG